MKHYSIFWGALLASYFLFSCAKKEEEIAVTSVSINQPSAEMIVGETVKLSAKVSPSNASFKDINWASSKQSVATISQDGLVTAIAEGSSTITASCGGKSATCKVTVSKGTVVVASIELNKTTLELVEGESETLTATVKPDDATDKTVSWTSNKTDVVSVDQNGKVKALKEGSATITAKAGDKSATCSVSVSKKVIPVTSVTLNKSSLNLTKGQTEKLIATVNPSNATDKEVSWSTSNNTIVSIQQDGTITAIKSGSATITAKAGEKTATCKVTVQNNVISVTSIQLNKTSTTLYVGESETLTATVYPSNATDKTVTWDSSNNSVATVNNGVVTALSPGTTTITARAGSHSATCTVSVSQKDIPVTGITLNKSSLSLYEGESESLIATIYPSNATDKTVEWSSEVNSVASVDQNGKVTAIKNGTTAIIARAGGYEARCSLVVEPPQGSVDLGLSVKWASCNLGASKPEEAGDYYAWGEIMPYYQEGHSQDNPCGYWRDGKTGYNLASYKYYKNGKFTKYCNDANYWGGGGQPDGKRMLDLEDDAANAKLHGNWHIPSRSEWRELFNNCTKKEVTQNRVKGTLFTSKINGNSIFIPTCHLRTETKLSNYVQTFGGPTTMEYHYWSSDLSNDNVSFFRDNTTAYFTAFVYFSGGKYGDYFWGVDRSYGMAIRPVTK